MKNNIGIVNNHYTLGNRLCIKPGIQERETECGKRGEWGESYIPGNVLKYSGECPQTFRGMSSNITGNVAKHSGECSQKIQRIFENNLGHVVKYPVERMKAFG